MVRILPPDYSVLDKLDIWKDYSHDEIADLYVRINHLDDPEQVKAIHEAKKNAPFGSPFVIRNVGKITPELIHDAELAANDLGIDKNHKEAIILEWTGKITRDELRKTFFISWFKKEIIRLREKEYDNEAQ